MRLRAAFIVMLLLSRANPVSAQTAHFPAAGGLQNAAVIEDAAIVTLRSDSNESARQQAAVFLSESGVCTKYAMAALLNVASGTSADGYPAETSPRVKAQAMRSLQACLRSYSDRPPQASESVVLAAGYRPLTAHYTIEVASLSEAELILCAGRCLAENLSIRVEPASAFDQAMLVPQPLGSTANGVTASWPMLGRPIANQRPAVILRALPPFLRWGQ